jgi:hypothetical protein
LPRIAPQLILNDKLLNTVCDTFWIDAKKNQLYMIYRAAYPMRAGYRDKGWIYLRDAQATAIEQQKETA